MSDYYAILGVEKTATPEEIKKAYKRLANKHHPDKGGSQEKFKEISVAYDTLSNPEKKAEYDSSTLYGNHPFGNSQHDFQDIFGQHFGRGFSDFFGTNVRVQRNRDLNLQCPISLYDSYVGKHLEVKFTLPSGKQQSVIIDIPPGIYDNAVINYTGLGDDTYGNLPRGNLHVTVTIHHDPVFERKRQDLYTTIEITPIEAMIGCIKTVKSITGDEFQLNIKPGAESGVEYAKPNGGFPNMQNPAQKGRFVIVIKIKTPAITDVDLINRLSIINAEIITLEEHINGRAK